MLQLSFVPFQLPLSIIKTSKDAEALSISPFLMMTTQKKIDTSRDNGTSCYASIFKHYDESQLHLVLLPEMDKQKEIPFSRFS
jgi:hypothetical protein